MEAFGSHGVQAWSARASNVSKSTVIDERRRNAEFSRRYGEALELSTAVLERRAVQWAAAGIPTETTVETTTEKPVVVGGETRMVATTTRSVELSPTMLIFLLKSRRPDVYRERQTVEHTGEGGGPTAVESLAHIDRQIAQLTAELEAPLDGQLERQLERQLDGQRLTNGPIRRRKKGRMIATTLRLPTTWRRA